MVTAIEKFQQVTGRAALPREFVLDFALFEARELEDGDTPEGIAEIKRCIHEDWTDPEKQAWWKAYIKEQADIEREIMALARGITERIKVGMKMRDAA